MRRREFLRVASGGAGATAVGASAAAAQETTPTPGATEGAGGGGNETAEGNQTTGGGAPTGGETVTVELIDYEYVPGTEEPLYITPGTTVNFVWITNTHNIAVDSQPAGANWGGHEPVEDAGFEYSHTFETSGTYEFHCDPHLSLGMEGTIIVNEQGAPPDTGGGGPAVPDSAKTLGIATSVALAATLGLAYVFLKYGGGDRPIEPE